MWYPLIYHDISIDASASSSLGTGISCGMNGGGGGVVWWEDVLEEDGVCWEMKGILPTKGGGWANHGGISLWE